MTRSPVFRRMACLLAMATALTSFAAQAASPAHRRHTISQAQAERIALGKIPGGRVRSAQLQTAKGQRFWAVDVIQPGRTNAREVHVDARTGKILTLQTERPEDQAEEPLKNH
ncbi:MAG: PepSY domain-containing protein [Verrucomicrobia bacterium]|nr:PepSY domain-containing protein [Verrucomicrobiota bacterium]